jgi:hypothetical protein
MAIGGTAGIEVSELEPLSSLEGHRGVIVIFGCDLTPLNAASEGEGVRSCSPLGPSLGCMAVGGSGEAERPIY